MHDALAIDPQLVRPRAYKVELPISMPRFHSGSSDQPENCLWKQNDPNIIRCLNAKQTFPACAAHALDSVHFLCTGRTWTISHRQSDHGGSNRRPVRQDRRLIRRFRQAEKQMPFAHKQVHLRKKCLSFRPSLFSAEPSGTQSPFMDSQSTKSLFERCLPE